MKLNNGNDNDNDNNFYTRREEVTHFKSSNELISTGKLQLKKL